MTAANTASAAAVRNGLPNMVLAPPGVVTPGGFVAGRTGAPFAVKWVAMAAPVETIACVRPPGVPTPPLPAVLHGSPMLPGSSQTASTNVLSLSGGGLVTKGTDVEGENFLSVPVGTPTSGPCQITVYVLT